MATTLSILISDTSGCLICQRLALAVVSGQLLQKPRMKSSGVCVVSCTAFRGSDRFTAIVLIRQRHVDFKVGHHFGEGQPTLLEMYDKRFIRHRGYLAASVTTVR